MENLIKIMKNSFFKGVYSGSGNIELHGTFEGVLKINTLYIKKTGIFIGKISAQTIIIEGEVCADIESETVHLQKTGFIDGNLTYRNLVIESGGSLKSSSVNKISGYKDLIKLNSSN